MTIKRRLKPKQQKVACKQVETYLARQNMPGPLIRVCSEFFQEQSQSVGEDFIGPKTMQVIIDGTFDFSEPLLEGVYYKSPIQISEYVLYVTSSPDMPSWQELTQPVSGLSIEAQHAYLFLTESALRVVYGILYEPDHVWKVVRFYDEEPVTTAG